MRSNRRYTLKLLVILSSHLLILTGGLTADSPFYLKILTYNIHHGEGMDTTINLERIAAVIKRYNPDLVALQEVDNGVNRSGNVDQPQVLSELTNLQAIFERNIVHDGGDYGNAVLTGFPIGHRKNHYLPTYTQGEQRGVLDVWVSILELDRKVRFMATHLDYRDDDTERIASAVFIDSLVRTNPEVPTILAGDLNDRPDSRTMDELQAIWGIAGEGIMNPTFPADKPNREIDYVLFYPKGNWEVIQLKVINEPVASDHRPVMVVLKWIP